MIPASPAEDFSYSISGGKCTIEGYHGSDDHVVIPDMIEGCPVTVIGDGAFWGAGFISVYVPEGVTSINWAAFNRCSELVSVSLPNTLTTIDMAAFSDCSSLEQVVLPDSLTEMPYSAFASCTGLTSVKLSAGLTRIGGMMFYGCESLTSIELHEGITAIEEEAFYGCTSLTSITIPDGVTTIGDSAFAWCDNLTGITIPEGVTTIGDSAFEYCNNLTGVTIPDSVTTIGDSAFESCSRLTGITIPGSVTTIGDEAFIDCYNLTIYGETGSYAETYAEEWEIPFVAGTPGETSEYKYIIGEDGCTIISYVGNGGDVVIPEEIAGCPVTVIDDSAFYYRDGLTSITIPDGVTTIGNSAFEWCNNLTSITIPDSVTSIGDSAFYNCDSLTSITIPDSVTNIGDGAFTNCYNLTIYGESGSYAESYAEEWEIPFVAGKPGETPDPGEPMPTPAPTTGTEDGFEYSIENGECTITGYAGGGGDVVIPEEIAGCPVTAVDDGAFEYCDSLTSITIPDGVTSIGDEAFSACEFLTSIVIPDSVTTIGDEAFTCCYNLTIYGEAGSYAETYAQEKDIPFVVGTPVETPEPDEPTPTPAPAADFEYSIENGECTITGYVGDGGDVVIPEEIAGHPVTVIGDYAFYEYDSLTSITIPDGVTSIGSAAFANCDSLISITIPNSVTTIGDSAFYGCDSLSSITIPNSVTSIGSSAFAYCHNLSSIYIPASVMMVGEGVFAAASSMTRIEVDSANTAYTTIDGVLFNRNRTELIQYPAGSSAVGYQVPEGVTTIGDSAFSGCDSLTSITIPDGVTTIGDDAFEYCYSLTSITIPDSVTSIGYSAFEYCYSLTSITIPDSVTSIGSFAFADCDSLTSITIPDSVTTICYAAFANCDSLTSISIPDSVTSIGYSAFRSCPNLTIHGVPGSYAETYANADDIPFSPTLPEQRVVLSSDQLTLEQGGGSRSVTVLANEAWSAVCDADWLRLETSGDRLTVTAEANSGSLRSAVVSLLDKAGEPQTYAYVYQPGAEGARLAAPTITTPAENGAAFDLGDVLIQWQAVEGAAEYVVSLRDLTTDTLLMYHAGTDNETSCTIDSSYLIGGCSYRVAVGAVPAGAASSDSMVSWCERTFSINEEAAVTTISIGGTVYSRTTVETLARSFSDFVVVNRSSEQTLYESPLAEVEIQLNEIRDDGGEYLFSRTTSDEDGKWQLTGLTVGREYTLTFVRDGFLFGGELRFRAGSNQRFDQVYGTFDTQSELVAELMGLRFENAIGNTSGTLKQNGLFAEYFQWKWKSKLWEPENKRYESLVDNASFTWQSAVYEGKAYAFFGKPSVSYDMLKATGFDDAAKREDVRYVSKEKFAVRMNGYLFVPATDTYQFRVRGDDGVSLRIEAPGETREDRDWWDGSEKLAELEPWLLLNSTICRVTLEYYNNGGDANFVFEWKVGENDWETVPSDVLYAGGRTVWVSDVVGIDYQSRLIEANSDVEKQLTELPSIRDLLTSVVNGKLIESTAKLIDGSELISLNDTVLDLGEEAAKDISKVCFKAYFQVSPSDDMTEDDMWSKLAEAIGSEMDEAMKAKNWLPKLVAFCSYARAKNDSNLLNLLVTGFDTLTGLDSLYDESVEYLISHNFSSTVDFIDAAEELDEEIKPVSGLLLQAHSLFDELYDDKQSNVLRGQYLLIMQEQGGIPEGTDMIWAQVTNLPDTLERNLTLDNLQSRLDSMPTSAVRNLIGAYADVDLTGLFARELLLEVIEATENLYKIVLK